ncbi:MAG: DUF5004 domain-containing protein [Flavipsychrobacter sp.]
MKNLLIVNLCLIAFSINCYGQKKLSFIEKTLVGTWKITEIKVGGISTARTKEKAEQYAKKNLYAEITFKKDRTLDYKLNNDTTIYHGKWKHVNDVNYSIRGNHAVSSRLDINIENIEGCSLYEDTGVFKNKRNTYIVKGGAKKIRFERINSN